jgi:D-glycero-alpha-D-manno-heptose 1-phosphate guanylyltransferase
MTAIVLVGGKNSLVSGLYPELPTPLIPVNGQAFLYWLTLWLKAQGFKHIVYSAGHQAEKISAWVNQMADIDPSLCLDIVTESRPLGTAGATALCAKRFPTPYTVVVNGNSILLTKIRHHLEKLRSQPQLDGIIIGTHVANAGRFGTLEIDKSNRLLAFKEKQPGKGCINAGIYLLRSELLNDITADKESSLEYDCFPKWLKAGKLIEVVDDPASFIDIGTPETLKRAHFLVANNQEVIKDCEMDSHSFCA